MATTTDIRREFDRAFRFVVKHKDRSLDWPNAKIKQFLRWAWYYERLFIVRDNTQIVALGVAWRTDHPENTPRDLSIDNTEFGDYLCWSLAIIHRNYRDKGLMFQLMYMATGRYPDTKRVFWNDRRGKLRITETNKLWRELYKWASLAIQDRK